MKKSLLMGAVVAVVTTATAVQAGQVTFYGHGNFRQDNGGEFQARVWSGNAGKTGMASDVGGSATGGRSAPGSGPFQGYTSFQTFCLEIGENVDLYTSDSTAGNVNNRVTVSIAAYAVNGGGGAIIEDGQSRDYISPQTAFLYTMFRRGSLTDYTYDNAAPVDGLSRAETARALQIAFWVLENELANVNAAAVTGSNATQVRALAEDYITLANGSGWTDIGNVRVINYLRTNGELGQSMLTIIPLPTAGGLAMAGLLGCGMTRRRFN